MDPLASTSYHKASYEKPKEAKARITKEMAKKVPSLHDWRSHYGDATASHDRHTYSHTTACGEYHMGPVFSKSGSMVGYHLKFAQNGKAKPEGAGLWVDLGVFSHPGKAVAAARSHDGKVSKSIKESLDEAVDKVARGRRLKALYKFARGQSNKIAGHDRYVPMLAPGTTTPGHPNYDAVQRSRKAHMGQIKVDKALSILKKHGLPNNTATAVHGRSWPYTFGMDYTNRYKLNSMLPKRGQGLKNAVVGSYVRSAEHARKEATVKDRKTKKLRLRKRSAAPRTHAYHLQMAREYRKEEAVDHSKRQARIRKLAKAKTNSDREVDAVDRYARYGDRWSVAFSKSRRLAAAIAHYMKSGGNRVTKADLKHARRSHKFSVKRRAENTATRKKHGRLPTAGD